MFKEFFRKKPEKVLHEHAAKEINDLKKTLGTELKASLYLYKEEKFIICSIAGFAEYGEPTVLDVNAADAAIGLAVYDKLLKFKAKSIELRPSGKLEDWPAYKASGAKTGNFFESNSIFVYFRTFNTVINMDAAPRISLEKSLKAHCSIPNGISHLEIGREIRKVIKAANVLRQAKMM
ncbi:hypothetical protein [Rheinheimera aquimaris]|uniref:hypothetical protein n=1 Tax=Rheinheimera aquimaris TaxID=412437 RepID=UPI003A97F7EC